MRILIENALIVDGTGDRSPYLGSVLVKDDLIEAVGNIELPLVPEPDFIIDAEGRYLTPGFIDVHTHTDLTNFVEGGLQPKIMQGVTTEVIGQCGFSVAPMPLEMQRQWREERLIIGDRKVEWHWETVAEYLAALEKHGLDSNVVPFVGHSALRFAVAGDKAEPLSADELRKLGDMLKQAFQDGAYGVSFGLIYIPAVYAQRAELELIAKIVSRYDGMVAVHLRSESDELLEAMQEMIEIFRGVRLHISHLKAIGERNWGKIQKALDLIDQHQLSFDHYPYLAGSTTLLSIFPPFQYLGKYLNDFQCFDDEKSRVKIKEIFTDKEQVPEGMPWDNLPSLLGWDNIIISGMQSDPDSVLIGKSLYVIGQERGEDPADVAMDLVKEERGQVMMVDFHSNRESVLAKLNHHRGMIGTDTLMSGKPHPRVYGTYPKILKEVIACDIDLPVEKVIVQMTARPAKCLGLGDRGIIAEGYRADFVIFSESVADRATYENPCAYPQGIDYVFINGQVKVQDGLYVEASKAGAVIRHRVGSTLMCDDDGDHSHSKNACQEFSI